MGDQDKNFRHNIKQTSDEEKEKYQLEDCNWSNTKFSKLKSRRRIMADGKEGRAQVPRHLFS